MNRVIGRWIVVCFALSALGVSALQAQQPNVPDNVQLLRDVEFGTGGNIKLKLHIIRPKTTPAEPMPVLVYINGSAWMKDNKDLAIGRLITAAQRGYFCVTIQVRTSGETVFPGMLEDTKCAVRYLRAKAKDYHIDTDHIGIWGESSGGHLSAMVGLTAKLKDFDGTGGWPKYSSEVHAVCSMCPAVDVLVADWPARHNQPGGPVFRLLGGNPAEDKKLKDLAIKASPLTYISKEAPPFYVVHGDADNTVPYTQGKLLYDALKKAGVDATFENVPGGGHGAVHERDTQAIEFFDKVLKKKS